MERRTAGEGNSWRGATDCCLSGLLLDRCLVCCCCCCSQLLSLSTCFTLLCRGVTRSREATTATTIPTATTTTSWRQPQLCLRQRHAANDPFNGPVHKMPPQPSLVLVRLGPPWSALLCLGLPWVLVNNWTLDDN